MIAVNFINKYLKVNQILYVLKHMGVQHLLKKGGGGKGFEIFFFVNYNIPALD